MKRILLFLWVSILFCSMLAAQDKEEATGKKYAVLVGVDDYTGGLGKLRYAKRDMEAFRDQLLKIGFEKENVFCLLGGGEFKDAPTKKHILNTIEHIRRLAKKGDILFLAMSGHGIMIAGESCFCPIDTDSADFPSSTIPISGIFDSLKKCDATFKLMIIDACRNDPFLVRSPDATLFQTLDDPPKGCLLLQSCSDTERSFEDPELEHGIFSYYLIEGLSGKAANKEGKITLLDMVNYADEKTKRRAYDKHRSWQTPRLSGEITNFIIWEGKPGPKAGDRRVLTMKGVAYAFRRCPAGTFMMGSPEDESGREPREMQRQVTLERGFWMLETEVTQEMWKSVMGNNPSHFTHSVKLPVEQVSWNDCQDYIRKLNALGVAPAGYEFSLPTEAQWEYACRAGTTTPYHFGSVLNGDAANCDGNDPYGTETKGKFLEKTSVVGSYPPNAWGLLDMHGNVCEWCLDGNGRFLMVRGGSWNYSAMLCRSARGKGFTSSYRRDYIGFRLALVAETGVPAALMSAETEVKQNEAKRRGPGKNQ